MKYYTSLTAFYNGEDWANCKAQVLNSRIQEDGVVYCEQCGLPIVKGFNPNEKNNKGAIVFHHKIYLTAQNVNDASISINPSNIAILHWACHNQIHQRFTGGQVEKKVYLITGAPCSGKTTYVRERVAPGDIVIDIDDIWQMLSKQDRYIKPNSIKPIVFKVRDELEEQVRIRSGTWRNAFIIKSLPLAMDRQRQAERLGAEIITMTATQEECINRLIQDPGGRDIEEYKKYIKDYYMKYRL